jgi:hypothetical protein
MSDPTYVIKEIKANPEWELAFFLSELFNDIAPIGWGRYILYAQYLREAYNIERKVKKEVGDE